MSFEAGTDEEEYRSFVVHNRDFFAKPGRPIEKCVQKDQLEEFLKCLQVEEQEEGDIAKIATLYRCFAVACRFKSEACFRAIVDKMVECIKGLEWHKNTILGVLAYGRLKEDLIEMAKVALNLGAEITKSGQYVRSPLLNAIQTGNYSVLSLFALKSPAAFSYKSPVNEGPMNDAMKAVFEAGDQDLLVWIRSIVVKGVVGHLEEKSPSRPTSSMTINTTATEYMSLDQLLDGAFLKPGDLVEGRIETYLKLANHFVVYVGHYFDEDGRHEGIIHKDGTSPFASQADTPNGAVVFERMEDQNYEQWRRAALSGSHSETVSPLLLLTSVPTYAILRIGLGLFDSTLSKEDTPMPKLQLDVIFEAAENIGVCNYDLIKDNCESFATKVKTGVAQSRQVQRVMRVSSGLSEISASLAGSEVGISRGISGGILRMS